MSAPSARTVNMLTGAITMLVLVAATVLGVKYSDGAFADRYQVEATFDAAGQGLISDSDVKIHGFNIGEVRGVSLEGGRARVRMDIDAGQRIPASAVATIRPKTLFGEKFVDIDPGDDEASGPFLEDEEEIRHTVGGFELERILSRAHPVLQAIDPAELATVLSTLAEAGEGSSEAVNRQIARFSELARIQASHDADTRLFLSDLALLSEELAGRADELVGAADDLNEVLPDLNERGDELAVVLDQAARLSGDVADLLQANRSFSEKSITKGGQTLQVLYDQRAQLAPLVIGLRQFLQTLAEVGRIPFGDGTFLAAIKFVMGEESGCGRTSEGCPSYRGAMSNTANAADRGTPPVNPEAQQPVPRGEAPSTNVQAVLDVLGRLSR